MIKIKDGIAAQLARITAFVESGRANAGMQLPMPPWAYRVLTKLGFEPAGSSAREISGRMERAGRAYRITIDADGSFGIETSIRTVSIDVYFTRWALGGATLKGEISIDPSE